MSASELALLYDEVREVVEDALKSKNRSQIRFASRRALAAFDSTQDIVFMNLYLSCEYAMNMPKSYRLTRDVIRKYGYKPDPQTGITTAFFSRFVLRSFLAWDQFDLNYDPRPEAYAYAQKFAQNWQTVMPIHGFLLAFFEMKEFELVEELALQAMNRDAFHATLFLMHVELVKGNYVAVYNHFCTLVEFCSIGEDEPVLSTKEGLSDMIQLIYHRFGLRITPQTQEDSESEGDNVINLHTTTKRWYDSTFFGDSIHQLRKFIWSMVQETDFEQEMDVEDALDAWQNLVGFFGPGTGEAEVKGDEIGYDPINKGIVTNGSY